MNIWDYTNIKEIYTGNRIKFTYVCIVITKSCFVFFCIILVFFRKYVVRNSYPTYGMTDHWYSHYEKTSISFDKYNKRPYNLDQLKVNNIKLWFIVTVEDNKKTTTISWIAFCLGNTCTCASHMVPNFVVFF